MAHVDESPEWADGIYRLETGDPVQGGRGGIANRQASELASRTRYLKDKIENLDIVIDPATPSSDGLMSSSDKSKLDGIAAGATADASADLGNQGTAVFGQAVQNGTAGTFARSDHRHALPAFPSAQNMTITGTWTVPTPRLP